MSENPCSSLTCPAVLPSTLTAMVTHRTEFFDRTVFDHLEVVEQVGISGGRAGTDWIIKALPAGKPHSPPLRRPPFLPLACLLSLKAEAAPE